MGTGTTMTSILRETTLGQLIRWATRNRYFLYPEERHDFLLPDSLAKAIEADKVAPQKSFDASPVALQESSRSVSDKVSEQDDSPLDSRDPVVQDSMGDISNDTPDAEKQATHQTADEPNLTRLPDGTLLVGWYSDSDPANPQNWTSGEKGVATAIIVIMTLAFYMGASICTPSYAGIMERFGVSQQLASLTLSMYVLAYGLGPMLWSPLTEIPSIGRNPPYIFTFAVFVILIVPTALVDNFAGLVVLRFLLGFFGCPCVSTGAASLGDLYPFIKLPYALSLWAFAAISGPAIGPVISGFSVPAESWRWSFWEMIWLAGPILVAMFVLLPETSAPTILLRRAQRLRALTGDTSLKSQSEIDQANIHIRAVVVETLWRPVQLIIEDPSIAFTALYASLIYGIFYSFFESFPLVFQGMHGFSLGEQGLTFLSITVGAIIAIVMYWSYLYWIVEPAIRGGKMGPPEQSLTFALPASFLLPIGLFIFAWTSSPSIPWIAPCIGIAVLVIGVFIVLQCIFLYLPISYPQYAASLFAGNDVARAALAAGTIHFAQPLYHNLGVDRGVTLLAGLTVGCIGGLFALWWWGDKLRARSKFAA